MFVEKLSKFEQLFTQKNESANVEPYKIPIKPHAPIVRKMYPVPIAHRPKVDLKMKEMIDANIIEMSNSETCSPLRVVIKDDDSVRVCLDARFVNAIIKSDHSTKGGFYDHLRALCRIFLVLQERNFTLKLDKSLFCRKSVKL